MAKIPVGATLSRAFRFVIGDFLKILGVMWLPWLILVAGSLALRPQFLALNAVKPGETSALGPLLLVLIPYYLLSFVLACMQFIGLNQLALGLHEGPSWFYFSLGRPLWRLIGSFLLLVVAFVIAYVIFVVGAALFAGAGAATAKASSSYWVVGIFALVGLLLLIGIFCGYIYAIVRLTFFLIPVIAAREQGFALERAWALGKGNFWRMFAIILILITPFLILECILIFGYLLRDMPPFPAAPATAEQLAAYNMAMQAKQAAMTAQMFEYWYIVFPVGALVMVLFYGLWTGAQAFAYRAVTLEAEEELEPIANLR